ncbi:endonuclease G [Lewinella marina]|uniref:Endonuclease n=1 Tax=Neolewinella marina TaxID=438751 RepID=A0A2G0CGA3_9BACT|nr:DNA/RNA non-specific endonuclease [Neolewinella marina]NJB86543.1 endonuclease G [Neolewinella marina]PHK99003.1 DNA/RNA endonuclease [Neolewinella marina]
MAKLRRNHARRGRSASGGTILKITLFALILFGMVWAFHRWNGARTPVPYDSGYAAEAWFLPAGGSGEVVEHTGFTLSYLEDWEQAEWVAYVLTRDHLDREWTPRRDNFREDPLVTTGSATDFDFRGSGYDRGHLAPFADFAWDADQADETFYLSNISPQIPAFNQGIWRELEENVREWARHDGRLYVVTGPVTSLPPRAYIGRDNRVAIPQSYYKVVLDLEDPEQKGIGFVIPNEVSTHPLAHYAMSIDEVEKITGIDFFPELMPADLEATIEARADPARWDVDPATYDRRITKWNNVN